jgi:hypothetical protein
MGRVRSSASARRGALRGSTLPEAVVASTIFLTLFVQTLGVLPRLAVRDDDALLVAEAEYRTERAAERYGSGLWPDGEYAERYAWGGIAVRAEPCAAYPDVQVVTVRTHIDHSRRRIVLRRTVERMP